MPFAADATTNDKRRVTRRPDAASSNNIESDVEPPVAKVPDERIRGEVEGPAVIIPIDLISR
jgi:hypothetical protein